MENTAYAVNKGIISIFGGIVTHWLGGGDILLTALVVFVIIDYLVGFLNAVVHKRLSSRIGAKGIAKKIILFAVVALAHRLDQLAGGHTPLREVAIVFYLANEGLSILENAADAGVPVPGTIASLLMQLKGKGEPDHE